MFIMHSIQNLIAEYRRRRDLHQKLQNLVDPTFLDRATVKNVTYSLWDHTTRKFADETANYLDGGKNG